MTNILNWKNTGTSPDNLIENGYQGGDIPQAEHFNYIFNNFSTCIKENREEIQKNTIGIPIPDKINDLNIDRLYQITEPGVYFGNNTKENGEEKYSDIPKYIYYVPPGNNQDFAIQKEFIINEFILEVSKTPDNKIYQSLSFYDSSNKRITFERFQIKKDIQTEESFSNWKNITPRTNKLLWSGCMFMQKGQNIDLSTDWKLPENQDKGIVLVWSRYDYNDEHAEPNLIYNFVPKEFFEDQIGTYTEGCYNYNANGSAFFLAGFYCFGLKWLGLRRTEIIGDEENNKDGIVSGKGITYDNREFVLRYVIGV